MCIALTRDDEVYAGEVIGLCDDPLPHLRDWLDPDLDSEMSEGGDSDFSGAGLLAAFCSTAKTVVFENYYFDLDYRSEMSKLQEFSFEWMSQDVTRIHFFSEPAPAPNTYLRDFVTAAEQSHSYLGYSIIRPQAIGRFGRSIVTPHANLKGGIDHELANEQIRTAVSEHVQLFGVPLEAVGVPFMEQDGRLLRCAHVSAWICHYSAVLRGAVARRPTSQFHAAGDATEAIGRPYPSEGLSISTLSSMLRKLDLPPEVIDAETMARPRGLTWADRTELVSSVEDARKELENSPEDDNGPANRLNRLWILENLSSTLCRYLNSAIPIILSRDEDGHTQVVVGYLRQRDLKGGASTDSADSTHSDVIAFIVTDDQEGPYEIVTLDTLVEEVASEAMASTSLVIPLPRALWMSGDLAEQVGIEWLKILAEDRLQKLESLEEKSSAQLVVDDTENFLSEMVETMKKFVAGTSQPGQNRYTVRTYACTGADFKESIASRVLDPGVVRKVGLLQLPRYVWVVEALDRDLRSRMKPSVRATIVLDATGSATRSEGGRLKPSELEPLFVHLPGQAFVTPAPAYGTRVPDDADGWFVTTLESYHSGRWSHDRRHNLSASRVVNQSKGAVAYG